MHASSPLPHMGAQLQTLNLAAFENLRLAPFENPIKSLFHCLTFRNLSGSDAPLPGAQLVAPPVVALVTAVAEAHSMASTAAAAGSGGASASYPSLEAFGQSMRYTAALLWASGVGIGFKPPVCQVPAAGSYCQGHITPSLPCSQFIIKVSHLFLLTAS